MSSRERIWDLIKALPIVAFLGWLAYMLPAEAVDFLVTDFADYKGNPENLRWPAFWIFAVIAGFAFYVHVQRGKGEQERKQQINELKEQLATSQKQVMQLTFPHDAALGTPWLHPDTGRKGCPQCGGSGRSYNWLGHGGPCNTCEGRGHATNKQARVYLFSTHEQDSAS